MITIPLYNSEGKKLEDLSLSSNVFGLKVEPALLHLVTTIFLGNQRKGTAKVKTRAERRGGGKKPFKQKGTSSARAGTTRSPIWRKGGRVFGPTGEQNYHRDLPKKVRVKSLLMGLSAKAQGGKMWGLDDLNVKEVSTKAMSSMFKNLPTARSILLVLPKKSEKLALSVRNLPQITVRLYDNINTLDILNHDTLVVAKDALPLMEKKWGELSFKGVLSDEELTASMNKVASGETSKPAKAKKAAKPAKNAPVAKAKAAPKKKAVTKKSKA